jgi:gas vesicle protein
MTADEDTFEDSNGSGPGFLFGIVVGAIAGAALTKLFGPAQQDIAEQYDSELSSVTNTAESSAEEAADRARTIVDRVRERVHDASEEAREAAREAEERGRRRFREMTEG